MPKKKQLLLIFSCLFALLFPSMQSVLATTELDDPIYQAIQAKKKLVVGLSAGYAPYEFHATVDGKDKIVGFDISIAEKIAEDLQVTLEIKELNFDALLGAMKTGKIDLIISGMTPTPEREKEVNFSDSYMEVAQSVVVRKTDKDKFKTVNDFQNVKVAVQKQTIQEELAKKELVGCQTISLQKGTDVIMNIQNRKAAAGILEKVVAEAYIRQDKNLTLAPVAFKNSTKETAIAVSKDAPVLLEKVNQSIATIKKEKLLPGYQKEASKLMFTNESFFKKYGLSFLQGAGVTIILAFIAVVFGTLIGALLALLKLSHQPWLKNIASLYIELIRGTPVLAQLFIVYFGTGFLQLEISAFVSGCIALSLNSGAYVAEILRAGIQAVPQGQSEAARSLGMNQSLTMRLIILPQAFKNILPALGNEFITIIKESSIVSVIGVSELMFQAGVIQGASFKPFLPIACAAGIYFILTFLTSRIFARLERASD